MISCSVADQIESEARRVAKRYGDMQVNAEDLVPIFDRLHRLEAENVELRTKLSHAEPPIVEGD